MADGKEELLRLDANFHADLHTIFEEGAQQFGDHLRALLFELWNRARQRPADADTRLEELEELTKAKTELRDLVRQEFAQQLPAVAQQFKSQIESITSGTFGSNLVNTLNSNDRPLDHALTKKLYALLNFDDLDIYALDRGTYLQFNTTETSGSSSAENPSSINIPELQEYDADDEFQEALRKRLHRDGLVPSDGAPRSWDWKPLFLDIETGRQGALNFNTRDIFNTETVSTYLTHEYGTKWSFPNPRPVFNYSDNNCEHVKIVVDGVDGVNSMCTWDHEHDSNTGTDAIKSVDIPGMLPTAEVRAEYTAVYKKDIP